jgi:hypothetical protein
LALLLSYVIVEVLYNSLGSGALSTLPSGALSI